MTKAAFCHVTLYRVDAVCKTPIRTAGADGDTESILRYHDSTPFIQGTSLAGAMRAWVHAQSRFAGDLEEKLFGSTGMAGSLRISDGEFTRDFEPVLRPRIHVDNKSGTVADSATGGGKFDIAHIPAGAKLSFTIHILTDRRSKDQEKAVEQIFDAMNQGEIRLGGQKTNGFGHLTLNVLKQCYDMLSPAQRRDWLDNRFTGSQLSLGRLNTVEAVRFDISGRMESLLVKASAPEDRNGSLYTVNMKEAGNWIIPGSSIKGVVRARVEQIAQLLSPDGTLDTDAFFGRSAGEQDNGIAGSVFFEDAVVCVEEAQKQPATRIRIDRFTGGVMRGALFSEEPLNVPRVSFQISAPNEAVPCALLIYALRDLCLGLCTLGSGSSIGRGFLRDGKVTITGPQGRAVLCFTGNEGISLDDKNGMVAEWLSELEARSEWNTRKQ